MPKLIAKTPIRHDGKTVAEGEPFTVDTDEQAKTLIDEGFAEAVKTVRATKPRGGDKAEGGNASGTDAAGAEGAAEGEAAGNTGGDAGAPGDTTTAE